MKNCTQQFKSIFTLLTLSVFLICSPILSSFTYITSEEQFNKLVLQKNVWAAVNFYVSSSPIYRCVLCTQINAIFHDLDIFGWSAANHIELFAVDVTKIPALGNKYGFRLPPTMMFFSQGVETGIKWQITTLPTKPNVEIVIVSNLNR